MVLPNFEENLKKYANAILKGKYIKKDTPLLLRLLLNIATWHAY